jgi:CRISPR-associated protein Csm2
MNNIASMSPEEIVREAENIARQLATQDRVKTGQIRNFYSGITRLRTEFAKDGFVSPKVQKQMVLLKPKLAYAAGRQIAVKTTFYPKMTAAVDGVLNAGNKDLALDNFFLFVESVVAYHKYYGGE